MRLIVVHLSVGLKQISIKLSRLSADQSSCNQVQGTYQIALWRQNCGCKKSRFKTSIELIQLVQRCVDEPRVDHLSLNEVLQLEKELDTALALTKHRKVSVLFRLILNCKNPVWMRKNVHTLNVMVNVYMQCWGYILYGFINFLCNTLFMLNMFIYLCPKSIYIMAHLASYYLLFY